MRRADVPDSSGAAATRSSRLEELLALAVALLAEEKGISLDQVRERLWSESATAPAEEGLRFFAIKDLKSRVGMSISGIYRMMHQGTFPLPRKAGSKSLWRSDEVEAWILSRERRGSDRD